MALHYKVEIDNSTNGQVANFTDISTDVDYSLIKAIRLYWGNFTDDQNVTTLQGSGVMDQWREYESLTVTPFIYDNKAVSLTSRFIPFISGINVLTGSIMQTTGRYSKYIAPADYLPTADHNVLTRVPGDMGISETTFPDRVYYAAYEAYSDTSPLTLTSVTINKQYIVYGGSTGRATIGTNIYRTGEVFIASGNDAVTFANGAVLKIFTATRFQYFLLIYNITKRLSELIAQTVLVPNAAITYEANTMRNQLWSQEIANIQNETSASLANQIIIDIQNKLTIINQSYPF